MMQFLNNNKALIGSVFSVGILLWAYFTFFTDTPEDLLVSEETLPVSQELLVMLSNLRTIKLDESIFSDPVFMSLSDFGVVIPPEAIGRRNPFAPIGVSAGSAASEGEEGE